MHIRKILTRYYKDVVKALQEGKRVVRLGLIFVLVGSFMLLLGIKLQQDLKFEHFEGSRILNDIGIALITLGIVGVIISFKDWTEYFKERLSEIVISRNYLAKLTKSELIGLQISTLKAFYEVEDIDREGSFLYYLQQKMQLFIHTPYREDINTSINVDKIAPTRFRVTDTITYKCRKVGGKIQQHIKWGANEGEFEKVESVNISIRCPYTVHENCHINCDHNCGDFIKIEGSKLKELSNGLVGFEADISEFAEIDQLFVKITSVYITTSEKVSTWQMAHPTKNFSFAAHFPDDIDIHVELFGMDLTSCNQEKQNGVYHLRCDAWVLPTNGIAFNFYAKNTVPVTADVQPVPRPA